MERTTGKKSLSIETTSVSGTATTRYGHDFNRLEQSADRYADQFVDRKTGRLKHPANPWGGYPQDWKKWRRRG